MRGRFRKVYRQWGQGDGHSFIIVDTETGVNYLWHDEEDSGGLTVLLGADGKPLISSDAEYLGSDM